MILVFSLGPTDNRRFVLSRGRLISSSEYRSWKNETACDIKKQWGKNVTLTPTFENQKCMTLEIFLPSKRSDQCNYLKGINDVLVAAGVLDDDRWICPLFLQACVDPRNPRAEVTI